jgi:hypothetical protein
VMAGNTISLVNGLPEIVENRAKDEKATAKGVNDQRKFDDAERYPILRSMASSLSLRRVRRRWTKEPSQP